jgi:hypothetical protein
VRSAKALYSFETQETTLLISITALGAFTNAAAVNDEFLLFSSESITVIRNILGIVGRYTNERCKMCWVLSQLVGLFG